MTGDHLSFDGNCGVRPAWTDGRRRAIQRCTALPFLCFLFPCGDVRSAGAGAHATSWPRTRAANISWSPEKPWPHLHAPSRITSGLTCSYCRSRSGERFPLLAARRDLTAGRPRLRLADLLSRLEEEYPTPPRMSSRFDLDFLARPPSGSAAVPQQARRGPRQLDPTPAPPADRSTAPYGRDALRSARPLFQDSEPSPTRFSPPRHAHRGHRWRSPLPTLLPWQRVPSWPGRPPTWGPVTVSPG